MRIDIYDFYSSKVKMCFMAQDVSTISEAF